MSECRWCDTCQTPFSEIDPDARRIGIQEPDIVNGVRRGVVTVERDQCGGCMRAQARAAEARRRELMSTETGQAAE